MNCCNSKGDSGSGDVIDFHQYLGPASPAPDGNRVSIDGEHGGFGLKMSNHMWFGDGQAYEMEPDSATLTRKYVANQQAVIASAQPCGISAAIYTQITDVEGELNGFFTYDRQVAKMDFTQVRDDQPGDHPAGRRLGGQRAAAAAGHARADRRRVLPAGRHRRGRGR